VLKGEIKAWAKNYLKKVHACMHNTIGRLLRKAIKAKVSTFVEPYIVPPLHRDQVSKPLKGKEEK
jgi:hypothetical protein